MTRNLTVVFTVDNNTVIDAEVLVERTAMPEVYARFVLAHIARGNAIKTVEDSLTDQNSVWYVPNKARGGTDHFSPTYNHNGIYLLDEGVSMSRKEQLFWDINHRDTFYPLGQISDNTMPIYSDVGTYLPEGDLLNAFRDGFIDLMERLITPGPTSYWQELSQISERRHIRDGVCDMISGIRDIFGEDADDVLEQLTQSVMALGYEDITSQARRRGHNIRIRREDRVSFSQKAPKDPSKPAVRPGHVPPALASGR